MSVSIEEVTEAHTDMLNCVDEVVQDFERRANVMISGKLVHKLEDAKSKWARLHVEYAKQVTAQQEAIRDFNRNQSAMRFDND